MNETMNLENRFFYRLIKVMYFFFLFISILISILICFSEGSGILWGLLWAFGFYAVLNILRESAIYVAFGTKISWKWLTDIQQLLSKLNSNTTQKNTTELTSLTPEKLANLVVIKLINQESPFNDLMPKDIKISETLESTAHCAALGYSLYIYILLIRNKFGKEVSLSVKNNLFSLLENVSDLGNYLIEIYSIIDFISSTHENPEVNLLIEDSSEEYKTVCHFLVTLPNNPYYLPDERRRHITFGEIDDHLGEGVTLSVMECLSYSKKQTIAELKPIVTAATLKPSSILGLKVCEELAWSSNPGCFESHLLRKHNNPHLFVDSNQVTQQDLDKAIKKDNDDINEFHNRMKEFQALLSSPNWIDDIEVLKEQADKLLKRSREIGGKALDIGKSFKDFNEKIHEENKKDFSESKEKYDEKTKIKLEEIHAAQDFVNNVMNDFYTPFIIQIHREDSPIKDEELAASVLAEDIETVKIFTKYSIRNNREISFKVSANTLVSNIIKKGIILPTLEDKLNIIKTIPGTTIFEGLIWSCNPGCFERQLQRQVNNSLFHPKFRKVSQVNIIQARQQDLGNILCFEREAEKLSSLVEDIVERKRDATFKECLELHKKISESIGPAYSVGGDAIKCIKELNRLKNLLAAIMKGSIDESKDKNLFEQIDMINSAYDDDFTKNTFLQQVNRDDSPIKPILITSLLSEPLDEIKLIYSLLPEETVGEVKAGAVKIVNAMLSRGENHPLIKEKLSALEIDTSFLK